MNKNEINIRQSINTDTIDEDFKSFTDADAPLIANTGIERNGGVTNIYENKETYGVTGQRAVTSDNKILSLTPSAVADYKVVKIDDTPIGQVSSYGVSADVTIKDADDVFLIPDGYVTGAIADATITVSKYNLAQELLATRAITFANMAPVMPLFTSMSFVKWDGMTYEDSLEFALRLGDQVVILKESDPSISIATSIQSTAVLGGNDVYASIVYKGQLIVAGAGGRLGSYDGVNWKNYDGTGSGSGLYQDGSAGSVIGSNAIRALAVYGNSLAVGGDGGRIGSYDGSAWIVYTSASGLASTTVVSTGNVSCMATYKGFLIVCSSAGALGSYNGVSWTAYSVSTAGAICDNNTLVGSPITSCCIFTDSNGDDTFVVAGSTGRLASFKIRLNQGGLNWAFTTNPAPASAWTSIAYGNGVWVAVAATTSTTAGIARSTDNGVTWSFVTTPAPSGVWIDVAYGDGVWMAHTNGTSTTASVARSTNNGASWSFVTTPAPSGSFADVSYGGGVWLLVNRAAVGVSATQSLMKSVDGGQTWSYVTCQPRPSNAPWGCCSYNELTGTWLVGAGCETASLQKSTDKGLTWSLVAFSGFFSSDGMKCYNGVWIAWNDLSYATILRSVDDGSTFSVIDLSPIGVADVIQGACYYNGVFLVSSTGKVCKSTDNGVTWSISNSTNGGYCNAANDVFITVSGTSTTASICRSLDKKIDKHVYTVASTPFYPTNNQTVLGANGITAMAIKAVPGTGFTSIVVAGGSTASLVGSFRSDGTWYNYNSTSTDLGSYHDNGTLINAPVTAMTVYSDSIVLAGAGKLACFYQDGTKHAYNSGLALSNNSTVIGPNVIRTLATYKDLLFVGGDKGLMNSVNSLGATAPFYSSGTSYVANLLEGFNTLGYLYVYRYENGIYLVNLVGNTLSKSYTLNDLTKQISIITASHALLQVHNGKSRHICTAKDTSARHIYDVANLRPAGLVGYTDFTAFSVDVVYPACPNVVSSVLKSNASWGYSDVTFRTTASATNILNYVSQFQRDVSGLYRQYQSNSNTLVDAYGKLTNNLGVSPAVPFEFRVNMINGQPSYFSVALLDDISTDAMGVILTNVGAINDLYQPEILADDTILYQDDMDKFRIKRVSSLPLNPIQKISDSAYKVNTISPLNVIDLDTASLDVGSLDFNNRMLFTSSAMPTTSTKIASFIQGTYSNSIDTGDKLVTILNPTTSSVELIGYRLPVVGTSTKRYSVDTYFNDIYSFSTGSNGIELVLPEKQDTVYVASSFLPMPAGSRYLNQTVQGSNVTMFLKPNYDGYSIGNDIVGNFDIFSLFGQTYLFDGLKIYLASLDTVTGIFASKDFVCSAIGLKLAAITPTSAYFVSAFDNSLYTFDGGRSLSKYKRLNALSKIVNGVYSTVDNELLFETTDSFIWVRDGIITQNYKAADQVDLRLVDTKNGIVIGNDISSWRYSYFEESGSTVVPLALQTSFYGFNTDEKSILSNWVITIYNERKDTVNITGYSYSIDEDVERTQVVNWTINPVDYNDGGYARIRLQPQTQRSLGTSLRLESAKKILVVSIIPEFSEGETAVVAASRSV